MLSHSFLLFPLLATLAGPQTQPPGLPKPLLHQIIKDHYEDEPEAGVQALKEGFEYRKIDLNGDGSPEFLIQAGRTYCGTAGCSLWIYRGTASGSYNLIYESGQVSTYVDLFEEAVLKSKTNGFVDLLFKDEPTMGGPYFQVLVFDGKRYKEYSECD